MSYRQHYRTPKGALCCAKVPDYALTERSDVTCVRCLRLLMVGRKRDPRGFSAYAHEGKIEKLKPVTPEQAARAKREWEKNFPEVKKYQRALVIGSFTPYERKAIHTALALLVDFSEGEPAMVRTEPTDPAVLAAARDLLAQLETK